MISMNDRKKINLRSIDSLRGFLAIYVLCGHARWLLWTGHAEWIRHPHAWWADTLAYASAGLRYGHEAVMVFFVLSGFFIHLRNAEDLASGQSQKLQALPYARRRMHRLVPPYLLALLITLSLDAVGKYLWPSLYSGKVGDPLLQSTLSHMGYSAASVWPALVFLPSSLGQDFGTNGPLWSLAYEAVYYAAYPLWCLLRQSSGRWLAFGVVPAAGLATGCWVLSGWFSMVISHYAIWLAGAALAEIFCSRPTIHKMRLLAGLAFLGGVGLQVTGTISGLSGGILAAVLYGTGLVCGVACLPLQTADWSLLRYLEFLGVRSYSIYITHFPFLILMSAGIFHHQGGRPLHGGFALTGALLAILFGCLSFFIGERHFMHQRIKVS